MASRRELLKAGLAAAALPLVAHAHAAAVPASVPIYKVLYDTRFPASVAFGRQAAANGVAAHAMNGDMTRFWYDDLYHRWRSEPAAIAGLTAHGALFCLEQLAWDHRMRVVFRGEHVPRTGQGVVHRFAGPREWLQLAAGTPVDGAWSAAIADVLTRCPAGCATAGVGARHSATAAASAPGEVLFSWVIAAVQRG